MNRLKTCVCALFALFAVCTFTANAQLFWKVTRPGSDKTSYLLGTHHFAPVELLDSIKGLDAALSSVEKLYGEIDMAEMSNPLQLMKYRNLMQAPADSTLDKLLTVAELDTFTTTWNKVSNGAIPANMVYSLKPAMISTQMMSMVMMQRFPDKDFTAPGIDLLMQNRAKEQGKEVSGLEDMKFQMELLYGEPIIEQKETLMESVRDGGAKEVEMTLRLTDAYMARDLDSLEAIMTDENVMSKEKAEQMIYARNAAWTNILAPEMQEKSLMVVVGAGHLPTERGLIALLRKAGYTVTPID